MEFLQARWGCKNPSPRRRRTTDPRIKMDGMRRMKEGEEWRSVAKRSVGAAQSGGGGGGGQRHVSSTHPGSVAID